MILILFIILCIIPTIFKGGYGGVVLELGGKNLTYFIFLYILGRYIRLHHNTSYNRYLLFGTHFLCTITIIVLNLFGTWLLNAHCGIFKDDCSPLILISALSIFFLFKSWTLHSKMINNIASSVLAVYVLSNIYIFLDREFIHLSRFSADNRFFIYTMYLVGVSVVFSFLIDKTIGTIIKKLLDKIGNMLRPVLVNSVLLKWLL